MFEFLKKAFRDMKQSAKAQHQLDKANFAAARAESKAQWEEAKAMGRSETRQALLKAQQDEQIKAARQRKVEAEERIRAAQSK